MTGATVTSAASDEQAAAGRAGSSPVRGDALLEALQALCRQNDDVVLWVAASQAKAKEAVAAELAGALGPDVLAALKRNADQLHALKREHVAAQQAASAKGGARRGMWWAPSIARGAPGGDDLRGDAAARPRFFQLPGSAVAGASAPPRGGAPAGGLRFWQAGLPGGAAPRLGDAAAPGDQGAAAKHLGALLFGKRRGSASSASAGSRRASGSDAGAPSWRSGGDASRRGSSRSSDSGAALAASHALRASATFGLAALQLQQQHAAAAAGGSAAPPSALAAAAEALGAGSVWSSLASGEGPLSKSHSLLAKPGPPGAELVVGRSLECVAEDDREGRDSPQPGQVGRMPRGGPAAASAALRVTLAAGGGRATSPIESFSFGNRADDEPHSPSFMRQSVSSRHVDRSAFAAGDAAGPAGGVPSAAALGAAAAAAAAAGGATGPLVRSSLVLSAGLATRLDPFDAPEPAPQPFVERMRAEDQALRASRQAAAGGLMGALRRSISGGRGGAAGVAAAAAAAGALQGGAPSTRRVPPGPQAQQYMEQQQYAQQPQYYYEPEEQDEEEREASEDEQALQGPSAGAGVAFLDLDATRAYALGVQQVMAGLARSMRVTGSSDGGSGAPSPRGGTGTAPASDAGDTHAAPPRRGSSTGHEAVSVPTRVERLELQHRAAFADGAAVAAAAAAAQPSPRGRRALAPPAASLSPQPSSGGGAPLGGGLPHALALSGLPPPGAGPRPLRPSSTSSGSRRASAGGGAAPLPTRGLPVLGQATMDILERPPASLAGLGRPGLAPGAGSSVRLTDVYEATAGNLTPLAAGLGSIKRMSSGNSSSHGGRPPAPRRGLPDGAPLAALLPQPRLGPLAAQHGSTMQHAKKSAQAAGLLAPSPRDAGKRAPPSWGWQSLGLPTGPGAPLADPTIDPATYGQGNRYAASWGLVDSAMAAAGGAGTPPGLSRQASALGGAAPPGAALSRQASGAGAAGGRRSPRVSGPGWQQGRAGGPAAARYASATPTGSQSPRSGAATPRRASDAGRPGPAPAGAAPLAHRVHHAGDGASDDASDDYASAEENMSTTSFASSSRGNSSSGGQRGGGAWGGSRGPSSGGQPGGRSGGGRAAGAGGASPMPGPPPFLAGRPTSAQAAVAAQWSPNKHASAIAQAPAPTYALALADERSGYSIGGQGLQPQGLAAVSPRSAGGGRPATAAAAYAGGHLVGSPEGGGGVQRTSSGGGGGGYGGYGAARGGPGAVAAGAGPGRAGGAWGAQQAVPVSGAAAAKAAYAPRRR
ncbi:hypothetical protein HT031_001695 [Scenedesmus sp. PABB004]|nr:hypothetical protein HT031_001695 [Scenedesmus sp. PABB004]